MKVRSVNNHITHVVSRISSLQLLFWKPQISQFFSDKVDVLHCAGSGLSGEDNHVIQNIIKELLAIANFE